MRFLLVVLSLFSSISFANGPTPILVIENGRKNLNVEPYRGGDDLDRLKRQIDSQQVENHRKTIRITDYFQRLYMSAMESDSMIQLELAIGELKRLKSIGTQIPGSNPEAGEWCDERIHQVQERLNQERIKDKQQVEAATKIWEGSLKEAFNAPVQVNTCRGCADPSSCNDTWSRAEAKRHKGMYRPPCGGTCGDPSCGNGWEITLASKYRKRYPHAQTILTAPAPLPNIPSPPVVETTPAIVQEVVEYQNPPSPPLEPVFPELAVLPLLQRGLLPIAEKIVEIGAGIVGKDYLGEYPVIETPCGQVRQSLKKDALEFRKQVEDGQILYKLGKRGTSNTCGDSQFWSAENPNTTPNYTQKYGMFERNWKDADFVERGIMKPGTNFITRKSPRITDSETGEILPGGGLEVVTEPTQVELQGHHSL